MARRLYDVAVHVAIARAARDEARAAYAEVTALPFRPNRRR